MSSKKYELACAPIEDSDQPAHLHSLLRVFDGLSMGMQGSNVSSSLKLDCVDLQTDLNLHCRHMSTCVLCCIPAQLL